MKLISVLTLLLTILLPSTYAAGEGMLKGDYFRGLFLQKHQADNEERILILTHGLMGHSGRYLNLIQRLNDNGITVYRYDLRGHGRSYGYRGHIIRFESFVNDLDSIVTKVKNENPGTPISLFGHSMGGLITYLYSAQKGIDNGISSVVLSAPALHIPLDRIKKLKLEVAKKMRGLVPRMEAPEKILPEQLSDDPLEIEKAINDPLIGESFTISLAIELNRGAAMAQEFIGKMVKLPPMLMIQGGKDEVVDANKNIAYGGLSMSIGGPLSVLPLPNTLHEPLFSNRDTKKFVESQILYFLEEN